VKVVIPVAGLGTRLRPHTHTKPKPLVQVAGQPVLAYILDQLKELPVDEVIYIVGHLGGQIEEYVRSRNDFPSRFIVQQELRGQAHALHLASDAIDQPILIIFVDTIVTVDLAALPKTSADGVLFVKYVDDPRRFGVAVVDDRRVRRLVEKPKEPVSNLAIVGVYYLKAWQLFKRALQEVIDRDIQTAGEYYLADALQLMIDYGANLEVRDVEVWEDCGTLEAILHTNRWMLGSGYRQGHPAVDNSVIVPPVFIAPTAKVSNSVIGPYASIGDDSVVTGSLVSDSIISDRAVIENAILAESLIGSRVIVRGRHQRLSIGDDSQVEAT